MYIAEGVPVPLRSLDNFVVIRSATLEAADLITAWTSTLAVLGTVKPATTTKAKSKISFLAQCSCTHPCLHLRMLASGSTPRGIHRQAERACAQGN